MDSLEHLKIPLDDIKLATNDFNDENFIGVGGFGKVYKGQLSKSEGWMTVAVKRLDAIHGQGRHEFLMEIAMLSRYQHKNLVTLLGFCNEKDEMILVYKHEFNGSLDGHLSSINLTWSQRLKICCGAARGLLFLHNPDGGLQRVIHRDIKSSNILLDHTWEAKISDFGLSKLGPANQQFTFLVTSVAGTFGYCDPVYQEDGILTKESDVYSFGVVLFEVLCGRLCFENYNDERRFLATMATRSRKQNELDDIIYAGIKRNMDPGSLARFSGIAYRCLSENRDERPTMIEVVRELEAALDFQEKRDANVVHMDGNTGLLDLQSEPSTFKQYRLRMIAQLGNTPFLIQYIEFNFNGELFATAGGLGSISVFNFSDILKGSLVAYHPGVAIQTSSRIHCLSWNKVTENYIASAEDDGTVAIWDLNNNQLVMKYKEHEEGSWSVDFSCTEPSLLVSGGMPEYQSFNEVEPSHVKVWSTKQKASVNTIAVEALVTSVKYHPGSNMYIAVGTVSNGCHYYDLRNTSSPLHIFKEPTKAVSSVSFLSDNELVCASRDNTLRLWNIKQNLLVRTYKGHTHEMYRVGLSVNNDFMACGSNTNEVFVYHKESSKPVTSHTLDSGPRRAIINDVCWKSDGSAIVAGDTNGVVQVLAFEAQD